jgi:hypothetical protein
MFCVEGIPMKKLLSLLIILLLAGCYSYATMPVHTMSDSQLQHEYLEKSSELANEESQLQNLLHPMSDSKFQHEYLEQSSGLDSAESQLQIQLQTHRQSKDFQEGMTSSLIYSISELSERLTALRIEMSKRGLFEP